MVPAQPAPDFARLTEAEAAVRPVGRHDRAEAARVDVGLDQLLAGDVDDPAVLGDELAGEADDPLHEGAGLLAPRPGERRRLENHDVAAGPAAEVVDDAGRNHAVRGLTQA